MTTIGRAICPILLALACKAQGPPPIPRVSAEEAQAIRVAEDYLRKNGYSNQPANAKVVDWDVTEVPMLQTGAITPDDLLLIRRNTICFPAYGVSRRQGKNPGWIVFFKNARGWPDADTASSRKTSGRAVEMGLAFDGVRLEHMDARLEAAEKILHTAATECPLWEGTTPPNKGMKQTKPG